MSPGRWAGRVLLLVLGAALVSSCAAQKVESPYESGQLFRPSPDVMADVETALEKAAVEDKLALIILGANWCHDSRALAARLYQDPLAELIEDRYEAVFVDVGYLDQGRDVARQFGIPIYYATPTVLIADPTTGRLVNAGDRHQWGAAASIGMDESVEYFDRMAVLQEAAKGSVSAPADPYGEIDEYESRMAAKVARGYARVGPMLRAYKEGGAVPASFEDDWTEVTDFRNGVPGIIESLRQEVQDRLAAGQEAIDLEFPPITAYSWE